MFNFFNKNKTTNANFVKKVLPLPLNQTQEALYLLLKNGSMTRRDFFLETHILNAPRCIHSLRKRGVDIDCEMITVQNKYGRRIDYGVYTLVNENEALKKYLEYLKS